MTLRQRLWSHKHDYEAILQYLHNARAKVA